MHSIQSVVVTPIIKTDIDQQTQQDDNTTPPPPKKITSFARAKEDVQVTNV